MATSNERTAGYLDELFGVVAESARCPEGRRRTIEEVVQLAVELARERREGQKIGTLFVVGDVVNVLKQSRPLVLDPLFGHSPDELRVDDPNFRKTVKEFAQIDGAFVIADDGVFVSAGRFV